MALKHFCGSDVVHVYSRLRSGNVLCTLYVICRKNKKSNNPIESLNLHNVTGSAKQRISTRGNEFIAAVISCFVNRTIGGVHFARSSRTNL